MSSQDEFEILIRRRIPFFSGFLLEVICVLFLVLLISYIFLLPTHLASHEMATAYYSLAMPEWLKLSSAAAGAGLLVLVPLYYLARLHKPATLIFKDNHILISGKGIELNIPSRKIDKVSCNDLRRRIGRPKEILQFVIKQKRRKVTTFRLKDYD